VVIGLDSDTTDALLWSMSRVPIRHRRSRPKPDRRALELLATSRDGCTEAIMLAHGFTVKLMLDLCVAGLATATPERMVAGGRTLEVAVIRITEAGRRALDAGPKGRR
jgi:hypothetical protein